ncbi:aminopeptidase N [Alteromonadaceae bacterium Bs31]|nr:aminopeptidase N [Alteromonadaceae bacterium Bs31]
MSNSQPKTIYLKDYKAPAFQISSTELVFDLFEDYADVHARLNIERVSPGQKGALVLHGLDLELLAIKLDGTQLGDEQYTVEEACLSIHEVPDSFQLDTTTRIKPQENTSLEGLYKSQKMFCTQCEAEGFRKITYYLDRPDVLSEFTCKVIADKNRYPVLLSNGNKIAEGSEQEGRHWVQWHDPFKKPCYLFALVAGDLQAIDDSYTTMSGREVLLRIFVEDKDKDKCAHAMNSLKKAMKWDEDVYGREYDLDIFMIVAVDDFNMGAMENKGLNIFNTSCVLAHQKTTTDDSFQAVEAVVAHEYFHNWSGNRVTCRDWFQLSLKEGFTVFRDSEFSADMGSRSVKRVEDVNLLRTLQFAEDAGPMAHPVQPSSFIEISNFYTLTIYEKGAEVVRMVHSLLGPELFRKGSDLYFERHDGHAVTIEDFIRAMADVSGRDFTQFMRWYQQAGTPHVSVSGIYHPEEQKFVLSFEQSCPPSPEAKEQLPFHIPISVGLLGETGPLAFRLEHEQGLIETCTLEITKKQQTINFFDVKEQVVPSLLRNFSAPVKLKYCYSMADLQRIISLDSDGFNRWDASQQLAVKATENVRVALAISPAPAVQGELLSSHEALLKQALATLDGEDQQDLQMLAYTLALPSEEYLFEQQTQIDVEGTHHARQRVKRKLANSHFDLYLRIYQALNSNAVFSVDAQSIARRRLKNTVLGYLVCSGKAQAIELCIQQFNSADNMTDELSALSELVHSGSGEAQAYKSESLERFFEKWKHEALVVNRWFSLQATNPDPATLGRVEALMQHSYFDASNPNKLRALVGGFCNRNAICFHDRSGDGYRFLKERIVELNEKNPQIASRLLTPLTRWKRFDESRQILMRQELESIQALNNLSKDVFEVVSKSLN